MAYLNPAITFQVNITPDVISLLHPDRSQTNQDVAIASVKFRPALLNTWFPGLTNADNIEQKTAYTFTAYGEQAHYILKTYAVARPGQVPLVSVIAWEYSDGSSKPLGTIIPVNDGQYNVGSVTVVAAAPVVTA